MSRAQVVMVTAACLALAGCGGGGGSNDQGVSFRAIGVFQEIEKVAPEADEFDLENPQGDTGRIISLSRTTTIANDTNSDGDADGGYIGLENNLDQAINVQGVNVEIFIPGALIPNPVRTDFVPLSITLQKVTVDDQGIRNPDRSYSQTFFVSSDVMAFLNQNQTLLPDTPFNMNVVMTITGIGETGDSFDTNEITYNVIVQP
jgi:hypothetical protein